MKTTLTILTFALFLVGCEKKSEMEQQAEALAKEMIKSNPKLLNK